MTTPIRQEGATAELLRDATTTINLILQGRINSFGSFTVGAAATSTVVPDVNAYASSVPLLMPANATAAAMAPYVSARATGSFTLTHAAPGASADFLYVLLG
ncbi:hypothetical protein [Sphingomonas sp.]|jgi:hypothetical protein|uniref:hypothetical protein n=1 Tax=Sphingomonas sp. TaxID=28214 RepID=UPI0035654055